jgi:hypothetical protein
LSPVNTKGRKMKGVILTGGTGGSSAFSRTLRWVLLWLQLCMGECLLAYWPLTVAARTENVEGPDVCSVS